MRKIFLFAICFLCFTNFLYTFQNNKEWKLLKSEHFLIYHQDCPDVFLEEVRVTSEDLYRQITDWLGFTRQKFWLWDNRAKIYIYKNREDFIQDSKSQSWAEGCADFKNKIIYTYEDAPGFMDNILPHEMGHLIFREFAGFGRNIPVFLDEGVALQMEKDRPNYIIYSRVFAREGRFLDFEKLIKTNPYYLDEDKVPLFYMQSFSIIYFLLTEYDKRNFRMMCRMLKDGKDFQEALTKSYIVFRKEGSFQKAWEQFWLQM